MVDLAQLNADPANWKWEGKGHWAVATNYWQKLKEKWYGTMDNQQLSSDDPQSLSLEQLAPEHLPFNNSSSSIFVRESYMTTFDLIWARATLSKGKTGALITGQPGTGKTTFLYYLLVRLLQRRQIVLFSIDGEELFLFRHDNVYRASITTLRALESTLRLPHRTESSSLNIFIWSLFDIENPNGPDNLLVRRPCLPVQTAWRDPYQTRRISDGIWPKNCQPPMLTSLTLWTRDELAQGLKYQEMYPSLLEALRNVYPRSHDQTDSLDDNEFPGIPALLEDSAACDVSSPEDALDYLLQAAIDRFGYSARDVFIAVFNRDFVTKIHTSIYGI